MLYRMRQWLISACRVLVRKGGIEPPASLINHYALALQHFSQWMAEWTIEGSALKSELKTYPTRHTSNPTRLNGTTPPVRILPGEHSTSLSSTNSTPPPEKQEGRVCCAQHPWDVGVEWLLRGVRILFISLHTTECALFGNLLQIILAQRKWPLRPRGSIPYIQICKMKNVAFFFLLGSTSSWDS